MFVCIKDHSNETNIINEKFCQLKHTEMYVKSVTSSFSHILKRWMKTDNKIITLTMNYDISIMVVDVVQHILIQLPKDHAVVQTADHFSNFLGHHISKN